jgi:hypothetical protein
VKALGQRATGLSALATGTGLLNVTLAVALDVTNRPDSGRSRALMALGAPECCRADRVAGVMVTSPKTHGPRCGLQTIGRFFEDDHVHMALVVGADRRLLTTIERSDLAGATPRARPPGAVSQWVGTRRRSPRSPQAPGRGDPRGVKAARRSSSVGLAWLPLAFCQSLKASIESCMAGLGVYV